MASVDSVSISKPARTANKADTKTASRVSTSVATGDASTLEEAARMRAEIDQQRSDVERREQELANLRNKFQAELATQKRDGEKRERELAQENQRKYESELADLERFNELSKSSRKPAPMAGAPTGSHSVARTAARTASDTKRLTASRTASDMKAQTAARTASKSSIRTAPLSKDTSIGGYDPEGEDVEQDEESNANELDQEFKDFYKEEKVDLDSVPALGYTRQVVKNSEEQELHDQKENELHEGSGITPLYKMLPVINFERSAWTKIWTISPANGKRSFSNLARWAKAGYGPQVREFSMKEMAANFQDAWKFGLSDRPPAGQRGGNLGKVLILSMNLKAARNDYPFDIGVQLMSKNAAGEWRSMVPHTAIHSLAANAKLDSKAHVVVSPKFLTVIGAGTNSQFIDVPLFAGLMPDAANESEQGHRWWTAHVGQIMQGVTQTADKKSMMFQRTSLAASAAVANQRFMNFHLTGVQAGATNEAGQVVSYGEQLRREHFDTHLHATQMDNINVPTESGKRLLNELIKATKGDHLTSFESVVLKTWALPADANAPAESFYPGHTPLVDAPRDISLTIEVRGLFV